MRLLTAIAIIISLLLLLSTGTFKGKAIAVEANNNLQMVITKAGSSPSAKGSSEYFTGNVRVDPLFIANDSARFSGAYVTFEQEPEPHGIPIRPGSV